ncbi:MAG: PEP-CTERM sorting domain-containing protein, partial [bacterium]
GNVVASFTSPTSYDGSQPSYFGFEADGYGTFDEIQVQVNSSAAILDNVQINSAIATPEPASIILLGTGLVGVFGVARRRMTRIV